MYRHPTIDIGYTYLQVKLFQWMHVDSCIVIVTTQKSTGNLVSVPWRNGENAGLVFQGSVVRAPAQEIFHSNRGLLSFKKPETVLWTIAKYYHLLLLRRQVLQQIQDIPYFSHNILSKIVFFRSQNASKCNVCLLSPIEFRNQILITLDIYWHLCR